MTDSTDYASFRQRLDAALRTRNVQQVRAFLIEADQWSQDQPTDPEYAMWLMIAGTPTLKDLHMEARQWLIQHGHAEAADAVSGRGQTSQGKRNVRKPGANQSRKAGATSPKPGRNRP